MGILTVKFVLVHWVHLGGTNFRVTVLPVIMHLGYHSKVSRCHQSNTNYPWGSNIPTPAVTGACTLFVPTFTVHFATGFSVAVSDSEGLDGRPSGLVRVFSVSSHWIGTYTTLSGLQNDAF